MLTKEILYKDIKPIDESFHLYTMPNQSAVFTELPEITGYLYITPSQPNIGMQHYI